MGCMSVDECTSGLMITMYEKDKKRSVAEEESLQAFAKSKGYGHEKL